MYIPIFIKIPPAVTEMSRDKHIINRHTKKIAFITLTKFHIYITLFIQTSVSQVIPEDFVSGTNNVAISSLFIRRDVGYVLRRGGRRSGTFTSGIMSGI